MMARNTKNHKVVVPSAVVSTNGIAEDHHAVAETAAPEQDRMPEADVQSETVFQDEDEDVGQPRTSILGEDVFLNEGEDFEEGEAILTSCSCRSPRTSDVFRVRPGHEWRGEVFLVDYRGDDTAIPHGRYVIVGKPLQHAFQAHGKKHLLVTCVTGSGQMFLWAIKITHGLGDSWYRSDVEILKRAEREWVRFMGSDGNAHMANSSKREWGEPKWQGESLLQLLQMAFDDRLVTTTSHPLCHKYEID